MPQSGWSKVTRSFPSRSMKRFSASKCCRPTGFFRILHFFPFSLTHGLRLQMHCCTAMHLRNYMSAVPVRRIVGDQTGRSSAICAAGVPQRTQAAFGCTRARRRSSTKKLLAAQSPASACRYCWFPLAHTEYRHESLTSLSWRVASTKKTREIKFRRQLDHWTKIEC